ncbi:MAG TPA: peptide chain release factor N(5)-glutamine methyltransferase [Methylomirabilota bacterium]|nr:peptide chain release factor N(5)-glutamine methyltransferase [Methylomirabilota bacterium]
MSRALSDATTLALLGEGTAALAAVGIPTARQDAEWLLASVLGVDRLALYVEPAREIAPTVVARYRAWVDRRTAHEPLQYILGFEEFRGLRLAVSPDVLIPRPETEGLVEWAIEILADRGEAAVADLGTGSGAIACAVAATLPEAEVWAIERSLGALAVAFGNVRRLGLADRVRLLAGDLFEPLGAVRAGLDLVVSNPPYLPTAILGSLPPEVSLHEPRVALDGGPDGMGVIRRIIAGAPAALRPGGWLLMEIGEEQAGPLASLMAAEGFSGIRARHDLRGVERYIGGRWGETSDGGALSGPAGRSC